MISKFVYDLKKTDCNKLYSRTVTRLFADDLVYFLLPLWPLHPLDVLVVLHPGGRRHV